MTIHIDLSKKTPAEIDRALVKIGEAVIAGAALNAETILGEKPLSSRTDPDWTPSDVMTPDDMIGILEVHARTFAALHMPKQANDLTLAGSTIDDLMTQLEESQATVLRLVDEIAQHTQTIAVLTEESRSLRYALTGVSEPGDAERIRRNEDEREADDLPGNEDLSEETDR